MEEQRNRFIFAAAACLLVVGVGCTQSIDKTPMASTKYSLNGDTYLLEDGAYEDLVGTVSLLGSALGDLNGDGALDEAAVLSLDGGGSGTFYYFNVLLGDGMGAREIAEEKSIGDRIKFDFVDIYGPGSVSRLTGVPIHPDEYGIVIVGYYAHGPQQSLADIPDVYVTRRWKIDDGKLVSVEDYQGGPGSAERDKDGESR